MIITALLLSVTAIAVGSALAYYWENIIAWLKKGFTKITQIIGRDVYGFKVFIEREKERMNEKSLNYLKDGNQWHEYSITREISENEVPAEILAKVKGRKSAEITQELAMELS